jgi:type IV pilus assembly protein PilE
MTLSLHAMPMTGRFRQMSGFTLIEVMVVTVIIAILATIAVPSYQAYVRRSNRAAAESLLMDMATRQQQRFLDVRGYSPSVADLGIAVPAEVSNHYAVEIRPIAGPPPGYRIVATPTGSQAQDSKCSPVSIDQAGARLPAGCW